MKLNPMGSLLKGMGTKTTILLLNTITVKMKQALGTHGLGDLY